MFEAKCAQINNKLEKDLEKIHLKIQKFENTPYGKKAKEVGTDWEVLRKYKEFIDSFANELKFRIDDSSSLNEVEKFVRNQKKEKEESKIKEARKELQKLWHQESNVESRPKRLYQYKENVKLLKEEEKTCKNIHYEKYGLHPTQNLLESYYDNLYKVKGPEVIPYKGLFKEKSKYHNKRNFGDLLMNFAELALEGKKKNELKKVQSLKEEKGDVHPNGEVPPTMDRGSNLDVNECIKKYNEHFDEFALMIKENQNTPYAN